MFKLKCKEHFRPNSSGKEHFRSNSIGKEHFRPKSSGKEHFHPNSSEKEHFRSNSSGKEHFRSNSTVLERNIFVLTLVESVPGKLIPAPDGTISIFTVCTVVTVHCN